MELVKCKKCGEKMNAIFCPSVRDTCYECGGVSKIVGDEDEAVKNEKIYS